MTVLGKKWAENVYTIQFYCYLIGVYTLITLYILMFISSFFIIKEKAKINYYFNIVNVVIGGYCSLYIIWRYNTVLDWLGYKFTHLEFTALDRMITYHAGLLLFGIIILYNLQTLGIQEAVIQNQSKQNQQNKIQKYMNTKL